MLSETITFLKFDHPTLYQAVSQFHFKWRNVYSAPGPRKLNTDLVKSY